MSIISTIASYEITLGFFPGTVLIDTSDTLSTVMGTGYLNGQTLQPTGDLLATPTWQTNQMAIVTTSDKGSVILLVQIDGESNINLVAPFWPS
jgi:hypothetical protein